MIIAITIPDGDFSDILTDISRSVGLTEEQYVANIVSTFIESQLRGKYRELLSKATLVEIKEKLGDYNEIKERERP